MRKFMTMIMNFGKKHPAMIAGVAAIMFIGVIVLTSLYSDAVAWDLITSQGGTAIGRNQAPSLTNTLIRYDAFQYTHIAEQGYSSVVYTAFLPLYPILISLVTHGLSVPVTYAAMIVSWLALCGAAVVLYKWAEFELKARGYKLSPWLVLGLLAVFPTSLFFALPYNEGLFLLLSVSALLLYRKGYFLSAGLVAALASMTRFQGILLVVFFLADLFLSKKRDYKKLISVALGGLGLLAYMIWLAINFHNPLAFMEAEKYWGRFDSNIILNLIHSMRPLYLWYLPAAFVGLWSVWRYLGWPYFLYSLALFLMPLSSGNLASINRYILNALPIFLGLAIFAQKKVPQPVRVLFIASSAFLLGWSVLLFANGYWVA